MLTDATRRQLQRLRFLLEEALGQTQDLSEVGRHTALVLLDGAVEYAMGVSLGYLGRPTPREFHKTFDALKKEAEPSGWVPVGWSAVSQLHGARNEAQHHGTIADPIHLPGWAAEAQRFIESLVETVFGVNLADVLIADSIEAADVGALLVEAETALAQEDAVAGFAASLAGFDRARDVWRQQRTEGIGGLTLEARGLSYRSPIDADPTSRSLMRFEDLWEVQPFAGDIAEYHWLATRRLEVEEEGLVVRLDDARRAFLFVVAWVLRWEAFAARYEARQHRPPTPPYEPPTTGADHPVVFDAEAETLHHIGHWQDDPSLENVRYSIRLTLADIPVTAQDLWASQVGDALNECISARGSHAASSAAVSPEGIVRFHGVTAAATAEEISAWLNEALQEGDRRYRKKLAEHQELRARLPEIRARVDGEIVSVGSHGIAQPAITEDRDGDGVIWLGIPFEINASDDELLPQVLMESVYTQTGGVPNIRFYGSTLWLPLDYKPAAAAALVAAATAEYTKRATARAEGRATVEKQRQVLEERLRRMVSESREGAH